MIFITPKPNPVKSRSLGFKLITNNFKRLSRLFKTSNTAFHQLLLELNKKHESTLIDK